MWHQTLIGRIEKQPRLLKTGDGLLFNLVECELPDGRRLKTEDSRREIP
jgi:hypothetical protein